MDSDKYDIEESTYFKVMRSIMINMKAQTSGETTTSTMLAGDPGIGKTSLVQSLSSLLGIKLITIEVPHIVEEHIINIPFIVFNPIDGTKNLGGTDVKIDYDDEDDIGDIFKKPPEGERERFDIKLASSNLVNILDDEVKVPDEEYMEHMRKQSDNIQSLFKAFGGSETVIPKLIQKIRNNYDVILFIDEFFRKSSKRIKNILRTILNLKIGLDDLPAATYVMYASNLNDEGLDKGSKNTDFLMINMPAPTWPEWINYMVAKHGVENDIIEQPSDSENSVRVKGKNAENRGQ